MSLRVHRYCLLVAVSLLTMVLPGAAFAQAVVSDPRIQEFAHYANEEVKRLPSYSKRAIDTHTGTGRGGEIAAYYDGTALKCLSVTLGLSRRDDITRYLFREGRVWAIDIFVEPYDPATKKARADQRKLKARYLLVTTGTRYVMTGGSKTYRRITEAERGLIDDIMTNLPHYRTLLRRAGR